MENLQEMAMETLGDDGRGKSPYPRREKEELEKRRDFMATGFWIMMREKVWSWRGQKSVRNLYVSELLGSAEMCCSRIVSVGPTE